MLKFMIAVVNIIFVLGAAIINYVATFFGLVAANLAFKGLTLLVTIAIATAFVALVVALVTYVYGLFTVPSLIRAWVVILAPPHFSLFMSALLSAKFYRTMYKFAKYQLGLYSKATVI